MNKTELLLQRLDDIGQSLKDSRQALALLALGLADQKENDWISTPIWISLLL